ncbi:hypothetical protein OIO90_002526 [Microbotryomycetes sp. JL221]|nr:hypothetical protein OIO90_002526 [Microbotryomycetes sp. JL221]
MFLHYIGMLLILAATVLLILVSVGTPIWDQMSFLESNLVAGGNSLLRMGQWGYCFGNSCTGSSLGYNLDFITQGSAIGNDNVDIGNFDFGDTVVEGLTYALVLNPIAAGFAAIALLAALFSNTACGIFASILAFWAFIVTLAAMAIDLGLFITTRRRLEDRGVASVKYGPAWYMVIVAAGLLLLASMLVCCTCTSSRKRRQRDVETRGLTTGEPAPARRRGFFGRRSEPETYADGTPVMTEKRGFFGRRKAQPAY